MGLFDVSTSIKATKEEMLAWKGAAEKANMRLMTWIRCVLDAASGQSALFQQLQSASLTAAIEAAKHMRQSKQSKKSEKIEEE